MFKFILIVLFVLMIVGGESILSFSSNNNDLWIITVNHNELLNSAYNGFIIIIDFISEAIEWFTSNSDTKEISK